MATLGRLLGGGLLLLGGLCLGSCGGGDGGGDGGRDAGADVAPDALPPGPFDLSVASWNVQNFFDAFNDPDTADDVPRASQVTAKIEALGRVLRALDADVIVLQEVENLPLLERLADQELTGYDERVLVDAFDPRGIDVAVLSRLPITRTASHAEEDFPSPDGSRDYFWARDALEVFVDVGGAEVIVMTVHFISMLGGADSDEQRLAEALQVRRIVDRRVELGNPWVVVAGDINDVPGSTTYAALLDDGGLRDVMTSVPEADRWTTDFSALRRQFDHVLATPALADGVQTEGVRILHGPEVDGASDHEPVRAAFRFSR